MGKFRSSCHSLWIRNGTLIPRVNVSENELGAIFLQETIVTRAAAYQAAKAAEGGADDVASIHKFFHQYIIALNGAVLNAKKLDELVGEFVEENSEATVAGSAGDAEELLDQLT